MNSSIDYYLNGPPMWLAVKRWTGTSLLDGAMWFDAYMLAREKEIHEREPRLARKSWFEEEGA